MDIETFAEQRRLRTRNLADGRPLFPLKGRGEAGRYSGGHWGAESRETAIIGSKGYVRGDGCPVGKVGVHVFANSTSGLASRLKALVAAGWDQRQRGELEAYGYLAEALIDVALDVIRVYRLHPGNLDALKGSLRSADEGEGPREDDTAPVTAR